MHGQTPEKETRGRARCSSGATNREGRRKHASSLSAKLMDNVPFGFSVTSPDGTLEYVNPAFTALFGYDRADLPDRAAWFEKAFPDPFERGRMEQSYQKDATASLKTPCSRPRAMTIRTRDGRSLVCAARIQVLPTGEHLVVYENMTERSRLEMERVNTGKMEAIGNMAGGIAHSVNNILMGIQGYTSLMLMKKGPGDPDFKHLKAIEAQVRAGSELTGRILTFSRSGMGEFLPADLNELVRKTATVFGNTRSDIPIRRKLQDNLPKVEMDQGQIEKALIILYVKARQSMPKGGDLLIESRNVRLGQEVAEAYGLRTGAFVLVTVTHGGKALDDVAAAKIFDPTLDAGGYGRGQGFDLTSAYGIIRSHGGVLTVGSDEGVGTSFRIYLPALEETGSDETASPEGVLRGTETILLVDDEDVVLEVNREILENQGYAVLTARNGKEALEIYRHRRDEIALVLLDMVMPGINGEETFGLLRRIDPGVKVILASGYSTNDQIRNMMRNGCCAFLQKPFGNLELTMKVREVIGGGAFSRH
jgi:two-component system cell cycle sensor histidine kinase/response regulator CckA